MIRPNSRPWTPQEKAIVETLPDEEAARKLGRSLLSVREVRCQSGQFLARPWIESELALVGTAPDAVIAKKLNRTVS